VARRARVESDAESISTRDRILRVAAEAFASHGYHGASLREILRLAEANAASGHYYFQSKQQLYFETVAHDVAVVNVERNALLDAFATQGDWSHKRLPELLRVYMGPHIRHAASPSGRSYGMIIGRIGNEPPEVLVDVFDKLIRPTRIRFVENLRRMFPRIEDSVFAYGVSVVISTMAAAPLGFEYHVPPVSHVTPRTVRKVEDMSIVAASAAVLALFKSETKR